MAAEGLGAHTTVTTIDSAITDLIHYAAPSPVPSSILAWVFDTPPPFPDTVYNSTLSACVTNGASVAFQFNGTSIAVYGSVAPADGADPPVSVYSVDGGSPTSFSAPQVLHRADAVQFFTSDPLPLGTHTLTINVTSASPIAPYYLDYLQYTTYAPPTLPSNGPSSHATSSTPTISLSLTGAILAASPSSTLTPGSKHTAPTGAVVGGVVGGLALICLLIALLHWRHSRHPPDELPYAPRARRDAAPAFPSFTTTTSSPSLVATTPVQSRASVSSQIHPTESGAMSTNPSSLTQDSPGHIQGTFHEGHEPPQLPAIHRNTEYFAA
ncbi:hypothetical protein GY45DRAFT_1315911 [Cubamyces sp. BRFM 1775]|nr:hypothetical protein GY45DRAFT_1315911 [Cubamyces sp. BRFM 1775]